MMLEFPWVIEESSSRDHLVKKKEGLGRVEGESVRQEERKKKDENIFLLKKTSILEIDT